MAGRCSRHGTDSTPSLMLNTSKNSFYCHGCQSGGDTIELACWLLGCEFKEAVKVLSRDFNISSAQDKQSTVYDYKDAGGNLIYQVVREDKNGKKQTKQRRPDGKGGWIWDLKGVERLPYRLPKLLKAINSGGTIYIAEGEKCVDALVGLGLAATTNSGGAGKWTSAHSQHFPAETEVIILPDNDNPGRNHAQAIAKELFGQGCKIKIIDLPRLSDIKTKAGTGAENKADIFDWLAAGHTEEELLTAVTASPYWEPEAAPLTEENKYAEWQSLFQKTSYEVDDYGCLCRVRTTKDGGTETIRLANFTARIIKEIVKDDGQASQMMFEIDGILAGGRPLPVVSISSSKFSSMSWPVESWGAAANINSGTANKDTMRHAIQTTGFNCQKETRFTHTGWRNIGGKWVYLHGGGAIGADNITVDLEEAKLTNYCLPPVISIQEAAKATLKCLELAPPEITYPLLATIFLAPLCEPMRQAHCEPSFVLWLSGVTGARKSTVAGLFLSHFGNFSGKALPGSFKDTENTLERKAFLLKDTIFCVDDYHPTGSINERRTMEKKAHSLIRGYGDRVGRGRMNSDISLRQSYIPRGLCIVTGEDVPALGQSATARILSIELQRGQVDLSLLTQLQKQSHLLAETMAGYIEWLRPQMNDLPAKYRDLFSMCQV